VEIFIILEKYRRSLALLVSPGRLYFVGSSLTYSQKRLILSKNAELLKLHLRLDRKCSQQDMQTSGAFG